MTTASTPVPLNRREQAVIDTIRTSLTVRGYPPSMAEIGAAVGIPSRSTVQAVLIRLEFKGWIVREPNTPRAIRILEPPTAVGS